MTNPYAKHIKAMLKTSAKERVIVERYNDMYYICNGYTLLRLPVPLYDGFARPLDVMFPRLENGEAAVRSSGEKLSRMQPGTDHHSMADILHRTRADKPVTVTGFTLSASGDKTVYRLTQAAGRPIFYNDAYISGMLEYCGALAATDDRYPVLRWEEDGGSACLLMPINSGTGHLADALDQLREVIGV